MSKKKNQHVVPLKGRWGVKSESSSDYTYIVDKKYEAVVLARIIAKINKSELVIHNRKGKAK